KMNLADRKKPGVAFWATVVVVVVLVAYPLSFGPACWISSRTGVGYFVLPMVYRPILDAMSRSRNVAPLCKWYAEHTGRSGLKCVDFSDSGRPIWLWTMVP